MTFYVYAGLQGKKKVRGQIEADSMARARSALRQQRIKIKKIKQIKDRKAWGSGRANNLGAFWLNTSQRNSHVHQKIVDHDSSWIADFRWSYYGCGANKNANMKRVTQQMIFKLE